MRTSMVQSRCSPDCAALLVTCHVMMALVVALTSLGVALAARDELPPAPAPVLDTDRGLHHHSHHGVRGQGEQRQQQVAAAGNSSGGPLSDEALGGGGGGGEGQQRAATARDIRWARLAFELMRETDCRRGQFTTERECRRFARIEMSQVNVYMAEPTIFGRVVAILPDGVLGGSTSVHDGLVVLDLYPEASFGHLVAAFYIDIGVSQQWCEDESGTMTEGSVCMTRVVKKRCRQGNRRSRRRVHLSKRCELGLLPLVRHDTTDQVQDGRPPTQLLHCRTNIPGFAACPLPPDWPRAARPLPACGLGLVDNDASARREARFCLPSLPLQPRAVPATSTGALRHNKPPSSSASTELDDAAGGAGGAGTGAGPHGYITGDHSSQCRVFETCDHAVLIAGAWNEWTQRAHQTRALLDVYTMLRRHHVKRRTIRVFHANGGAAIEGVDDRAHMVHPASDKASLRGHIQKLCRSPHCVDSLLIYLNSPTDSEGNMFLWDTDRDGKASDDEQYPISELLSDVTNCQARQVTLLVDQSHAGELARTLRSSRASRSAFRNCIALISGRDNEYAWSSEFTRQWTVHANHTDTCVRDIFREARRAVVKSTPEMSSGSDTSAMTLFGAPCDVTPPLTSDELRQNYLGCQTLPTALWMKKIASNEH